jgi:hypothetical protein
MDHFEACGFSNWIHIGAAKDSFVSSMMELALTICMLSDRIVFRSGAVAVKQNSQ